MKISVIMVDGGFRENVFAAKYFSQQDFPHDQYEVIWLEYFDRPHPGLKKYPKVKVITLNKKGIYHSSYCFNRGIVEAKGELLVIPDADLIVEPGLLSYIWKRHRELDKLVIYGYRYDERRKGLLKSHDFAELKRVCTLGNTTNHGGCLTVRKKWLLEINGYEQHPLFRSGNHANGFDIYTRFKNLGLAVQWDPNLILYHPWHFFTLSYTGEHRAQRKLTEWRQFQKLQWMAFDGIDPSRNAQMPADLKRKVDREFRVLEREQLFEMNMALGKRARETNSGDWIDFYKKAVDHWWKKRNKRHIEIYRVASLCKDIGQLNKAGILFLRLMNHSKDKKLLPGVFFHLGELTLKKGKPEEAKELFKKCLALTPGHQKAAQYLEDLEEVG